jgi:hypothetical protein
MNIITRIKNILVSPAKEWEVIGNEEPNTGQIITGYVIPLAGAAAIAAFIGYGLIGLNVGFGIRLKGFNWGIYQALSILIMTIGSVFISAAVMDALASNFGSEKNMGRSIQLVAYSYTPVWLGALLAILPSLSLIGSLAGLYGLYLLYTGIPRLKKTPPDNHVGYFVVSLIVLLVVYFIIGLIMSKIVMSAMGLSYQLGDLKISF